MLDKRVLDLINAEIDGELAPEQGEELGSLLESSAEARAVKAELQRLANLLNAQPEQEPPAGLAARIMEQIRLPARDTTSEPKFSLAGLLASFQPAQAGLAFAAGLLLTVGFYEATQIGGESVDLSQVVGTMVANPAGSAAQTQHRDSLSITGPGLSGTVSLGQISDYMVLNFDLESAHRTEIEVGLAEAGLGFGGIAHASAAGNAGDETYEVSGGALRVVSQGRQVFSVFLPQVADPTADRAAGQDGGGREISIGIFARGAPVYSGVLRG